MKKALIVLMKCYTEFVVLMYSLFYWSPWGSAYIMLALQKYVESDWYKERIKIFRKREVMEMYFVRGESWFFKRRISKRETFGIIVAPYFYPARTREVLEEKDLLDCLDFLDHLE